MEKVVDVIAKVPLTMNDVHRLKYPGGIDVAQAAIDIFANYMLAHDRFTQTAADAGKVWQDEMSATPAVEKATKVGDRGEQRDQWDEMKIVVPGSKMAAGAHLAPNAEKMLRKTVSEAQSAGGGVVVMCPDSAPPAMVGELMKTGATVMQDQSAGNDYVMKISRLKEKTNV
jgi:hypothetical protein